MSKRVYIALFAVLIELIAIAATGNKGVSDFVADHMATSPLGDLFLRSLPSFPWLVTSDGHPATFIVAQWSAIATFVVVTFVLLLITVRGPATFSGPFFAAIPIVISAGLIAHEVANIVDYDKVGRPKHTGLGRVGYSLFNSNDGLTIMYSLMCGVVVAIAIGIVGLVIRRRAVAADAEVEPALFAPGMGTAAYGPPSDSGGFAVRGVYPPGAPGTLPWGTESYPPAPTPEPSLASYGGYAPTASASAPVTHEPGTYEAASHEPVMAEPATATPEPVMAEPTIEPAPEPAPETAREPATESPTEQTAGTPPERPDDATGTEPVAPSQFAYPPQYDAPGNSAGVAPARPVPELPDQLHDQLHEDLSRPDQPTQPEPHGQ